MNSTTNGSDLTDSVSRTKENSEYQHADPKLELDKAGEGRNMTLLVRDTSDKMKKIRYSSTKATPSY